MRKIPDRQKKYLTALGDEIRDQRQFVNMTQRELADRLGVATATIQNIEQVRQTPNFSTVIGIAEGLDLYPSDLMSAVEHRMNEDRPVTQYLKDAQDRIKDRLKTKAIEAIESL